MPESSDEIWMRRALELAKKGLGYVEPNPMVGCVVVHDQKIIGEGWHQKFGSAHAEANALASATNAVQGATAYVTLEPCSHQGQTPPCTNALIAAGISRVVVAHPDPNPLVAGTGIQKLRSAGLTVDVGVLQNEAADILAPYLKRIATNKPWVIAKWAMTLDGKIATGTGDSQWISNEQSRSIVHNIRGRVDAVMIGANTASGDDPLLTARPSGPRSATRVVLDSMAQLKTDSQLCRSAHEFPTLIAVGPNARSSRIEALKNTGCEIWSHSDDNANQRLLALLEFLSQRGMTNILVEGGSRVLGSLNDLDQIDETHIFVGPKLLGGHDSLTPIGGTGQTVMSAAKKIIVRSVQQLGDDVYIVGRRSR